MRRDELGDLTIFLAVAEERSFTRAAARLNTSQSSVSQTVRRLEARLGLRLLTRTTRSVAPTEAGEKLLATLRPAFDDIDAKLAALTELRQKPAGTIRITSNQHAAETILWPAVSKLLRKYPDVKAELSIDSSFIDIVTSRFDAGVRLGEQVAKDMVAVRIGPDLRNAVVGAPSYFRERSVPKTPRELTHHTCINMRLATLGGIYVWVFGKNGRDLHIRVDGPLVFNNMSLILKAATEGFGLACVMEDRVAQALSKGTLVRVLDDWCPTIRGYHLYYTSRRQSSPAFALLADMLRYRATR